MTVESTTRRAQYATNGVTVAFSVPFYFLQNSHLEVIYTNAAGVETTLALTTDYTVTGAGVPAGGTVTTVSTYAAGGYITILRQMPFLQETDYTETDAFPAESHERALDERVMETLQLREVTDRALVLPVADSTSTTIPAALLRLDKFLAFNLTTGAAEVSTVTQTQVASAVAAAYAAGSTADAVTFLQAGANAVARSVQAKLRDVVSPEDFGAVGDGVTDDTAEWLAAVATGKTVVGTPGKTYALSDIVELTVAGTKVYGQGCKFTPVAGAAAGTFVYATFFKLTATNTEVRDFEIVRNAASTFDNTLDGNGMPVRQAIVIAGSGARVHNVRIVGDRSAATASWIGGIVVSGNPSDVEITQCTVKQGPRGFVYAPGSYVKVIRCLSDNNYYHIDGDCSGAARYVGNVVHGNSIRSDTYTCYMGVEDYTGANGAAVTTNGSYGCEISNNIFVGGAACAYFAISAMGRNQNVCDNQIINWGDAEGDTAIEIPAQAGARVHGNAIIWATSADALNLNPNTSTSRIGIYVSGGSNISGPNVIEGNQIDGALNGIFIASTAASGAQHTISANSFRACYTAIRANSAIAAGVSRDHLTVVGNTLEVVNPRINDGFAKNHFVFFQCDVAFIGNKGRFAASSNSAVADNIIQLSCDNAQIIGNTFDRGSATTTIDGLQANGYAGDKNYLAFNKLLNGITATYSTYTNLVARDNIVSGGITGASNNNASFFDGQTVVAKTTGYGTPVNLAKAANLDGTAATLGQVAGTLAALITELKAAGLIGA